MHGRSAASGEREEDRLCWLLSWKCGPRDELLVSDWNSQTCPRGKTGLIPVEIVGGLLSSVWEDSVSNGCQLVWHQKEQRDQ
mmetsp:Transcript_24142/g.64712  ORF Transcript_24142/g.64712 Transcript_24142/m.64712 type:complete len:82 (+) Transcript_24142:403-648(+)